MLSIRARAGSMRRHQTTSSDSPTAQPNWREAEGGLDRTVPLGDVQAVARPRPPGGRPIVKRCCGDTEIPPGGLSQAGVELTGVQIAAGAGCPVPHTLVHEAEVEPGVFVVVVQLDRAQVGSLREVVAALVGESASVLVSGPGPYPAQHHGGTLPGAANGAVKAVERGDSLGSGVFLPLRGLPCPYRDCRRRSHPEGRQVCRSCCG
jgi:hypothetical protein